MEINIVLANIHKVRNKLRKALQIELKLRQKLLEMIARQSLLKCLHTCNNTKLHQLILLHFYSADLATESTDRLCNALANMFD